MDLEELKNLQKGLDSNKTFSFILETPVTKDNPSLFAGYTLFMPAVSVGHVGQLTTDLLLSNLPQDCNLTKFARIYHEALEPVVGWNIKNGKGSTPDLMTCCEVFVVAELKFVILHFHAPVTMKGRLDFVKYLVQWIQYHQISLVVCFSSIFAADRIDPQLVGIPFRYLSTDDTPSHLVKKLQELEWKHLERREFPAPAVFEKDIATTIDSKSKGVIHLPGSGITKSLYEACVSKKMPFLGMIMFASEGDNTPEAMTLFQMADRVFGFRSLSSTDNKELGSCGDKLIIPISWSHFEDESESHSLLY